MSGKKQKQQLKYKKFQGEEEAQDAEDNHNKEQEHEQSSHFAMAKGDELYQQFDQVSLGNDNNDSCFPPRQHPKQQQQHRHYPQHSSSRGAEGGIPLQPQLHDDSHDSIHHQFNMEDDYKGCSGMAPFPMTYSRSSPLQQRSFSTLSRAIDDDDGNNNDDNFTEGNLNLMRTFSTPEYFPSLRSRSEGFGSGYWGRNNTHGPGPGSGASAFSQPKRQQHYSASCARSDPGISAFHPVVVLPLRSSKSLSSASDIIMGDGGGSSSVALGGLKGGDLRGVDASVGSVEAAEAVDAASSVAAPSSLSSGKLPTTSSLIQKLNPMKFIQNRRRSSLNGRENPARPSLSEEYERGEEEDATVEDVDGNNPRPPLSEPGRMASPANASTNVKPAAAGGTPALSKLLFNLPEGETYLQYDDPGVALSCSSSSDDDDDKDVDGDEAAEQIVGQYHLLDREEEEQDHSFASPYERIHHPHQHHSNRPSSPRPPSIEVISPTFLPTASVEIISSPATASSSSGSTFIESPLATTSLTQNAETETSPAYHPLVDESDNYQAAAAAVVGGGNSLQLKYKSPMREEVVISYSRGSSVPGVVSGTPLRSDNNNNSSTNSSSTNNSNNHSNHNSPSSQSQDSPSRNTSENSPSHSHDSNHSGTNSSSVLDGPDYEVREANRRCTSSDSPRHHDHNRIPHRGFREEVVVDLDGNATVFSSSTTSSNFHDVYIHIPKPLREGAICGVSRLGEVDFTMEPGEEAEVAKFISLSPKKMGSSSRREAHSPHTISSASVSNTSSSGSEAKTPLKFVAYQTVEERESPAKIIQPRVYQRPPKQHKIPQKPPRSPEKFDSYATATRCRTPTKTPPPSSQYKNVYGSSSGAITPCSPPVIVDQVIRYDFGRSGPTKPSVVRSTSRSGSGSNNMILIPPSAVTVAKSSLCDNMTVLVDSRGANDGAQEVFTAPVTAASRVVPAAVSPDSSTSANSYNRKMTKSLLSPRKKGHQGYGGIVYQYDQGNNIPYDEMEQTPAYALNTPQKAFSATSATTTAGPAATISPDK